MQQQNAQQQMRLQQQGSGGSGAQGVMQGGAPGTLPNQVRVSMVRCVAVSRQEERSLVQQTSLMASVI